MNQKSKRNKKETKGYSEILEINEELKQNFRKRVAEFTQESVPNLWEEPYCNIHWVPVDGGEIRVLHIKPENPTSIRPIVLLSGWQAMAYLFEDMFKIFYNRVEIYFVETREKYSSKIKRRKTDFSVSQKARDTQAVIEYFKLDKQDFVLFGTCWGATIVLQGLLDGVLKAPTTIAFSPMYKLWLNKFLLKYIIPLIPSFIIAIILKITSYFLFVGEKAEIQKNRMLHVIRDAEVWKWKKTALAAKNLNLFGKLSTILEEVLVIGGTEDRVHKANDIPRFADELPNGRFFNFGIDEYEREAAMGLILLEYSKITFEQKVPNFFVEYEKDLQ